MTQEISPFYIQVKELMTSLSSIYEEKANFLKEYTEQLRLLEQETNSLREKINQLASPFNEKIVKMEEVLTSIALSSEKGFKTDLGEITYRKGYIKVTYSSKQIDILLAADPALKDLLSPYRKESIIKPNTSIKLFYIGSNDGLSTNYK